MKEKKIWRNTDLTFEKTTMRMAYSKKMCISLTNNLREI